MPLLCDVYLEQYICIPVGNSADLCVGETRRDTGHNVVLSISVSVRFELRIYVDVYLAS